MGSRIREGAKHFFECFCEVAKPQPDKDPWIIQKFPEAYKDEEVLRAVPKFAFPCDFERGSVQHFSFVLTDIDSKWTFGYVRHGTRSETALVVLSYLPWHESFQKFLNTLSDLIESPNGAQVWTLLQEVQEMQPPDPGGSLSVKYNDGQEKVFVCKCPDQFQLPSIPENRNLTEYYSAVDAQNMMIIFASMLYERRIIFTSKRLSRLSACVQAANAVLYPMNWQHIFIPVLPMSLIDYLLAPMPFLIGVPTPVLQRVSRADLGEVVILNADNNTVETPFDDLETLPVDVVSSLKRKLRNRAMLLGDGVSRAFLQALVQLIGGYRDALRFYQGEKITFNPDAFVESRPPSIQPFLRKMLELQIFQQFIEERLQMLNAGLGFSDEFELEACNYSVKSSSKLKQHYKEWSSTMKKEGSAFFKTVKSKANPAVKSAVKSVKERGKEVKERSRTAYKGIRSKFGEGPTSNPLEHSSSASDVISFSGKPRSAPASPTAAKRRPKTLAGSSASGIKSYYKDPGNHLKPSTDNKGRSLSAALASLDTSPESPEGPLQFSPINMDLLGDMQDVIFSNCNQLGELARRDLAEDNVVQVPVDRSLKPMRSVDNGLSRNPGLRAPLPLSSQRSAPLPLIPSTSRHSKPPFPDADDSSSVFSSGSCPPAGIVPPPRSRKHLNLPPKPDSQPCGDLIRLDSTPSEDFDPLKPSGRSGPSTTPKLFSAELLATNPPVYEPVPPPRATPSTSSQLDANDRDLLKEYGLEFESSSGGWMSGTSSPFSDFATSAPNPKGRWATFD